MAAYDTSLGRRGILEEGGQQPSGPVPLSTSAGSPPRGPIPLSTSAGSPPRGAVGGSPPRATAGRPASRPASRPAARSEKLAEMGGGLGGETRIFARGQTIFWRLLQLATAIIALAVMTASSANGMYFQYYQAFIFMVAAMTAVAAWCLAHLLHSIGRLMTRKWRITLFALLDFLVAWIALAGASAAAGLTSFADKGSGMVQPGYCQVGGEWCREVVPASVRAPRPPATISAFTQTSCPALPCLPACPAASPPRLLPAMQMGLFSSFCARTKAATAMAFITFFVLIPSLIASATRAVVSWFED
ncbi:unnamed protein product [Closterium sp. NIES-65]|nr:unnamed protein product [Closterium sp. NIES-65]